MKYTDYMAENRRLTILRLLKDVGGAANDSVIHQGLESFGHRRLTRSTVQEDIRFLAASGLVVEEWAGQVQIATITRRGVDVAEGREEAEGVQKPSVGV